MRVILLDDYSRRVVKGDVPGTVTTQWGNPALRHGWKIIEVYDRDERDRGLLVQGEVHPAMGGGFIVVLRRSFSGVRYPIYPERSNAMGPHAFA